MPTETDPGPAVQRLLLGEQLKELRVARGLSADEVSAELGWYRAKLGKIELGLTRAKDGDLDALLTFYQADTTTGEEVRQLASESRRKNPAARVANFAKQYVALLGTADEIQSWTADVIPGPLQTFDYARALLGTSVTLPPSEIDRVAEDRVRRGQRIIAPGGAQAWFILGEEVLHREIGGRIALREQLEHIRHVAELPNVTVQVLPFSAGAHVAIGQRFLVLRFNANGAAFVYVEGLTTADYLRGQHVTTYSLAFDRLRTAALPPAESLPFLDKRITALSKHRK